MGGTRGRRWWEVEGEGEGKGRGSYLNFFSGGVKCCTRCPC
jgi:hypothetical protein